MNIEEIIEEAMDDGSIASYQYFNLLKNRCILFNDECDTDIVEKVGLPLLAFDKDSSTQPVHLYINTGGGNVFSSLFICNIIDNYSKPLYIHILGYALSMGYILACAGANNPNVHKDCYPFSLFMLHAGSISINGTSAQTKSFMKFNSKIEDKVKQFVLSHTSMTEEIYDKFADEDYWLTAEDALSYGVVDNIIGEKNSKEGL